MMRKSLIILTVVCLAALVVAAGDKTGKATAAEHAAKIKADLGLNDDQAAQIEAILNEDMARMMAARDHIKAIKEELKALGEDSEANAEAIEAKKAEKQAAKAEYEVMMKEHHARVRAVLTEEQAAKFDQMVASHKKEGKMGEKH